jgi:tripartite-type tricarboxylate transporter receptor subunit TctC
VLPFAAGGVADITARIVAEKLGDKLGQRFVVENQAGAGGITAARTVISSPPDGYTLALLSNGTAVSVSLFKKLPFDPLKDFAAISSLGYFDFIFATAPMRPTRRLATSSPRQRKSPARSMSAPSMSAARRIFRPSCSRPRPASISRSSPIAARRRSRSGCCRATSH